MSETAVTLAAVTVEPRQPRSTPGVTQRPGMPGGPADLVPVPSSPARTARSGLTAIKVIDQQNLCLLSRTRLLLSPARRWHISLARPGA